MGLDPMCFVLLYLSGEFVLQLWLLAIQLPRKKSDWSILVDTNLIPWRLIRDLPDAISQREIGLFYLLNIPISTDREGCPPLGQSAWREIKSKRRELGNLTASHIQTVKFEKFCTPCSPVMSRIFVSAKYSLPWTVWDKHWWSFASFQSLHFLNSRQLRADESSFNITFILVLHFPGLPISWITWPEVILTVIPDLWALDRIH